MDKGIQKMMKLLTAYAEGNFAKRVSLSSELNGTDAIINSLHMLGEELHATTISKNYFTNIFDSVSDMIFVLTKRGTISNCNRAACAVLKYCHEQIIGKGLEAFQPPKKKMKTSRLLRELKASGQVTTREFCFITSTGQVIPVDITISYLLDNNRRAAVLMTARDITHILETDNLILNTIISTQEKERQRLAKDIHDSIGQQMSAVKFFISAVAETEKNKEQKRVLRRANEIIAGLQSDIRRLCFNLMPKTLEDFGLMKAIQELCDQLATTRRIRFLIGGDCPRLSITKEIEVDTFRIVQEFIANALTHSAADLITIRFSCHPDGFFSLSLTDNGRGLPHPCQRPGGMGLHNIQCRVRAHNGDLTIHSSHSKGTCFDISIPIN